MSMRATLTPFLAALSLAAVPLRADPPAIDLGAGFSSLQHLSGHLAVGWTSGDLYHAVKFHGSSEFMIFPDKLPAESMLSLSFLAGPYVNWSFAFASASAGLSVLEFEDRVGPGRPNPECGSGALFCADSLYDTRETFTIGIPVEILATVKLWYVGWGLRLWANPNLHNPMGGISSVLFLGGGPTRARARRTPED